MPEPAALDRLLSTAERLRPALQAVREARKDLHDEHRRDYPERTAARTLLDAFDAKNNTWAGGRRMLHLARLWREVAVNAYWYGMDEYQPVESTLYQNLGRHGVDRTRPTGREIRQLKDSIAEAQVEYEYQNRGTHEAIMQIATAYNHAVKHPDRPVDLR